MNPPLITTRGPVSDLEPTFEIIGLDPQNIADLLAGKPIVIEDGLVCRKSRLHIVFGQNRPLVESAIEFARQAHQAEMERRFLASENCWVDA